MSLPSSGHFEDVLLFPPLDLPQVWAVKEKASFHPLLHLETHPGRSSHCMSALRGRPENKSILFDIIKVLQNSHRICQKVCYESSIWLIFMVIFYEEENKSQFEDTMRMKRCHATHEDHKICDDSTMRSSVKITLRCE